MERGFEGGGVDDFEAGVGRGLAGLEVMIKGLEELREEAGLIDPAAVGAAVAEEIGEGEGEGGVHAAGEGDEGVRVLGGGEAAGAVGEILVDEVGDEGGGAAPGAALGEGLDFGCCFVAEVDSNGFSHDLIFLKIFLARAMFRS